MTDIVFAHDGTVAKIVGDALHVLFGAPGEQPITPHVLLAVPWHWMNTRNHSANAGARMGSRSEPPALVFMPAQPSSAISAATASSITAHMATRSTSQRGWKRPTSSLALVSVSAEPLQQRSPAFG